MKGCALRVCTVPPLLSPFCRPPPPHVSYLPVGFLTRLRKAWGYQKKKKKKKKKKIANISRVTHILCSSPTQNLVIINVMKYGHFISILTLSNFSLFTVARLFSTTYIVGILVASGNGVGIFALLARILVFSMNVQ